MTQGQDQQRWTVGRLLTWTADFLKGRGSESPRLDAEVLLAFALGGTRVALYTHFEDEVSEKARATFRDLVRRRGEGAPVAYLVGKKEFYSLALKVSPAVLIPRPDSEFVVLEFLTATKGRGPIRAVDVGTGSGNLALACLKGNTNASFVAIDASASALAIASENAEALGMADRVDFRLGNLLEPVATADPFDAIVSNPPYIRTGDLAGLEPGVRLHEPLQALDGGPDGLAVVGPLIAAAVPLLKPGGLLILEIGSDQEEPVRDLVARHPEYELGPTIHDHARHPRVIRATRAGG